MKAFSTNSDSRGGGSGWPVLARLPDVSEQVARAAERSDRAAAAGFVNYRFDPPQTAERAVRNPASADAAQPLRPGEIATARPAQPHILRHAAHHGRRGASRVLPRSDLFATQEADPQDRFAEVVRFLCMFALFTAAGTWILSMDRQTAPPEEPARAASTASQPSLEMESISGPADVIEQPVSTPTAVGPLGDTAPRTGLKPETKQPTATANRQARAATTAAEKQVAGPARLPKVIVAEGAAVEPSGGNDPEVESSSTRPPAVARLPGYILPAPLKQAQHDNQSSLY